jgi:hypothetical protein
MAMKTIVEQNGKYFIGTIDEGRCVAKCEDIDWCNRWVEILNDNPLKEAYLASRKHYGL